MYRRKSYVSDPIDNILILFNNILCQIGILFDTHIKYGYYGDVKFVVMTLLVFLKIRKPFNELEVAEFYFDL